MPATAVKRAITPPPAPGLFSSPEKRTVVLSLVLTAFTLLLYNTVAHNDFVNFDDDRYIYSNPHVQAGLTWDTISWAFGSFDQANWHPLTWLSHALDCQLFHLNPAGHHYVNVLWHTLNVLLLFLLLQAATKSAWRSFMVAVLFAVHPLNVESVAWIAERKNVLCTFFFLLSLGAYGYYVRKPQVRRYLAVAVFFALGLMSKPMVITLPFVLLLIDYWPLARTNRVTWSRLVAEKVPLMMLAAISAVITMRAQSAGGAVRVLAESSLFVRIENALASYMRYIGKTVWPIHLSPMYPRPTNVLPLWEVAAATVLLVFLTCLVLRFRDRRYLPVGWFFFLGTLVPMIGLVQVGEQAMADRYVYIPLLGLFVAITWALADWADIGRIPVAASTAVAITILAALSVVTTVQIGYWRTSFTLWSHALAVTDNNFVAEDNLGSALVMQGKPEEAIRHFQAAARINPRDPMANLNIGAYYQEHRDFPRAVAQYNLVLTLTTDALVRSNGFRNLGMISRLQENYSQSNAYYQSALQLDPENPATLVGLGLLAQKTGDLRAAVSYYSKAVNVQPTDVGFLLLAQALDRNGQQQQAQSAILHAQQLSRDMEHAWTTARAMTK